LNGCADREAEQLKEVNNRENIVIAFVDLTGSNDETITDVVIGKVIALFEQLPENSKFYLYPVNFGTNIETIFAFKSKGCEIIKESDKKRCEQFLKNEKNEESSKLKQALISYQKVMALPENKKLDNSCLINKMITSNNLFKSKYADNGKYQLSLVFFSDMIEDCSESFNNKAISFEDVDQFSLVKRQLEQTLILNAESSNLKTLGVKLIIVQTVRKDLMPFNQLQELWDIVFTKFGFEKGEAMKCHWTAELPDIQSWDSVK
jgi:hypothetical protein